MMDLEKDTAQGLGCSFQAVCIPDKKKRAIKSCCRVDSQNSPFLTLGVTLWSTLFV